MKNSVRSLVLSIALWCVAASPVFAGAAKIPDTRTQSVSTEHSQTVSQTVNQTINHVQNLIVNTFETETHRIITGTAQVCLAPNFLDNDWDLAVGLTACGNTVASDASSRALDNIAGSVLSSSEQAFLRSATKCELGFQPDTQYFLDLTSQTLVTSQGFPCASNFCTESDILNAEIDNFDTNGALRPKTVTSSKTTSQTASNVASSQASTEQDLKNVSVFTTTEGFGVLSNFFKTIVTTIDTTHLTTVTTTNVTTNNTVNTTNNDTRNINYQLVGAVYDYSPLVLDLKGDNKIEVANNNWMPHAPKFYVQYAKFFDIAGTGTPQFTEWMAKGAKDGLLVLPDEDGAVVDALQLFGTAGGFKHGFEKLAIVCDKDHNGWIEGEELSKLKIWIDDNNDAVCQPSEQHNLAEFGITRISVAQNNYVGQYMTADGKSHLMWDWWPAAMETRKLHTASKIHTAMR